MKKISVIITAIALMLCFCLSTFAAGSVTYVGGTEKYVFLPGSNKSPTDLFDGFKDVMPGDHLTQQIFINNDKSNDVKIKLYMRSLGADEKSVDFLSKLDLKVTAEEETVMFDAAADQTDGLTEWVCVGTIYSGGKVTLDLELDVPADLSDEFQYAEGYITWEFKTEELPVEKTDPEAPQTGDFFYPVLSIAVVSVAVIAVVIGTKKKVKVK